METNRVKRFILVLLGVAACSHRAAACGPWFEAPPPTLPFYLDRLPAKSFGAIYLESSPKKPDINPPGDDAILALADQVAKRKRADLLAQVDQFLAAARENYTDADQCNLLNDIRDVLSSKAANNEAADYIRWRMLKRDWFDRPNRQPDDELNAAPVAGTSCALEIEKRAASASDAMKPQWLYLRGALGFCGGDREECAPWFEKVWKQFPGHPRAESALFLSGRCALAQSRSNPAGEPSYPVDENSRSAAAANAATLFNTYMARYPNGRFVADVRGWLGGLAYNKGDSCNALADYIAQLETPGHPEVAKSALLMCEKVLSQAKADDDKLFALIAAHPVVAMGTTYFVLNNGERPEKDADDDDDDVVPEVRDHESARQNGWRRSVLPRLAAQVASQQARYRGDHWPPRYLAILAQAASAAGNQEQALQVTAVPQLDQSDDLLFARGLAFQRAGRPPDATACYRALLEKFPKSQLALGVQLKLAMALQDTHQAGAEIIQLKKLRAAVTKGNDFDKNDQTLYPPADTELDFSDSSVSRDISGADVNQIDQLIDTLYNFAPLGELVPALTAPGMDDALRKEMRAVLAERYLVQEDFADADKFLDDPQQLPIASGLEKLTAALSAANAPAARAEAMLQVGDAWAGARGKLLGIPLETGSMTGSVFADDTSHAPQRRRENGQALGLKNLDAELEDRDELRHASRWWMRAARALPGTPVAASARFKALEAMPKIAGASDYAFQRAVETRAGDASRQLYDRLRSECPASVEAGEAAYWSFPMPKNPPVAIQYPSFDEHSDREQDAIGQMGYYAFDDAAFGVTRDFTNEDWNPYDNIPDGWQGMNARILALEDHNKVEDTAQLAREVDAIRKDARRGYTALGQARYLTLLDDLALFLQEPNLNPGVRSAYIELRLWFGRFKTVPDTGVYDEDNLDKAVAQRNQKIAELLNDPQLNAVPDYVDFIRAAQGDLQAGDQPATTSDPLLRKYKSMELSMRAFLAKYPKSRKREAARLMLARAVHWLTTPTCQMWSPKDDEPDPQKAALIEEASYVPSILKTAWHEKFDAKRALEPLDAYDREFPNGHYASDIRDYRATVEWNAQDWGRALDDTMANLDDAAHPDLQPDAALRLANIFAGLAEPGNRTALLVAIRQRPKAVDRLKQYLLKTWQYKDHPLRYLGTYLADQCAFPLQEPAPTPSPAN